MPPAPTRRSRDGDPWKQQFEAFGEFLRAQRKLANLSLRDLSARTEVSNGYLSQLERGMHAPRYAC